MNEQKLNSLKIIVRAYYDYQRERMNLDGRLGQKKNGQLKKGIPDRDEGFLLEIYKRREDVLGMESALEKQISIGIQILPIWKAFFEGVKGCGPAMAAVCVTEFDVTKAETVSKMWQFAGLNPGLVRAMKAVKTKSPHKYEPKDKSWEIVRRMKDCVVVRTREMVRGDKRTQGFLCPFNQFLRSRLCGVLGPSFLKCNSPYRAYYDNKRAEYEAKDWGMAAKNPSDKARPKANHQHRAANRFMIKMFLQDLYAIWRAVEGLPIRAPYDPANPHGGWMEGA